VIDVTGSRAPASGDDGGLDGTINHRVQGPTPTSATWSLIVSSRGSLIETPSHIWEAVEDGWKSMMSATFLSDSESKAFANCVHMKKRKKKYI
jgi:hypothetical protein